MWCACVQLCSVTTGGLASGGGGLYKRGRAACEEVVVAYLYGVAGQLFTCWQITSSPIGSAI